MAITFINSAVNNTAAASSLVVNVPTNTQNGDIMFAIVSNAVNYSSGDGGGVWTKIGQNTDASAIFYQLYYRIASSEPASYTWYFPSSARASVVHTTYRGDFNSTNPIAVFSNTVYATSDRTVRAASMTTTIANTPLFYFGISYYTSGAVTYTKPTAPTTDWVENYDGGALSSDLYTEVCSMIWTSSGATGDMDSAVNNTPSFKHAFAIGLNLPVTGSSKFFQLF